MSDLVLDPLDEEGEDEITLVSKEGTSYRIPFQLFDRTSDFRLKMIDMHTEQTIWDFSARGLPFTNYVCVCLYRFFELLDQEFPPLSGPIPDRVDSYNNGVKMSYLTFALMRECDKGNMVSPWCNLFHSSTPSANRDLKLSAEFLGISTLCWMCRGVEDYFRTVHQEDLSRT